MSAVAVHIFISYAKKDTFELADDLNQRFDSIKGLSAWMDRELKPDSSWAAQIKREINRCDLFLVLISPDVNRAETPESEHSFVINEIYHAKYVAKKTMLVVMAQATDLPLEINTRQYIDLTKNGIEAIIEAVCEQAQIESPRQAAARLAQEQARQAELSRQAEARRAEEAARQAEAERQAQLAAEKARLNDEKSKLRQQRQAEQKEAARRSLSEGLLTLEEQLERGATWASLQPALTQLRQALQPFPDLAALLEEEATQLGQQFAPPPPVGAQHVAPKSNLPKPDPSDPARHADLVRSIIGGPFEWCPVTAGLVTLIPDETDKKESYLKAKKILEVPAFWMAKYPVTNSQFRAFIKAGGYQERQWWTEVGWEAREQGLVWDSDKRVFVPGPQPWSKPRYWGDAKFNQDEQPVVGVSFWESLAFANWLTASLPLQGEGQGGVIRLPTEAEWQRAAQGDDGRVYPWGNEWDRSKCNAGTGVPGVFSSLVSGKTTPVRKYGSKGASPFGVVDMAGNVLEWCLTNYEDGLDDDINNNNSRVLRGGSWEPDYFTFFLRMDFRNRAIPTFRKNCMGFRFSLY